MPRRHPYTCFSNLDRLTRKQIINLEYDASRRFENDKPSLLRIAKWLVIRCRVLEGQERYEMVQRYLERARSEAKVLR
jgi:hypothetical protein